MHLYRPGTNKLDRRSRTFFAKWFWNLKWISFFFYSSLRSLSSSLLAWLKEIYDRCSKTVIGIFRPRWVRHPRRNHRPVDSRLRLVPLSVRATKITRRQIRGLSRTRDPITTCSASLWPVSGNETVYMYTQKYVEKPFSIYLNIILFFLIFFINTIKKILFKVVKFLNYLFRK